MNYKRTTITTTRHHEELQEITRETLQHEKLQEPQELQEGKQRTAKDCKKTHRINCKKGLLTKKGYLLKKRVTY